MAGKEHLSEMVTRTVASVALPAAGSGLIVCPRCHRQQVTELQRLYPER